MILPSTDFVSSPVPGAKTGRTDRADTELSFEPKSDRSDNENLMQEQISRKLMLH